jgi:hypothetical protein
MEQRQGVMLSRAVIDRYRCPENFLDFDLRGTLSSEEGFFRFGANTIGYGRSYPRAGNPRCEMPLHDFLQDIVVEGTTIRLPFDPSEIIDNLRLEHYPHGSLSAYETVFKRLYYLLRPLTTLSIRKHVQRLRARNWQKLLFPRWPVDTTVEDICETLMLLSLEAAGRNSVPFVWFWPRGARGCVLMTHDVESEAGRDFCEDLLDLDDAYGIRASFQIVPAGRYTVPAKLLDAIRRRGFEIGLQDLNHDGRLFDDRKEFLRRIALIHWYASEYKAQGFRAAVLYRKPEWYDALNLSFDLSIPNVAHLDPQRGGCCTVMPYFIGKVLEIPVTTIQDYSLFHLLSHRSIDLWKDQVDLILKKNGLASFIVHPDYIRQPDTKAVYENLLGYLRDLRENTPVWYALPHEINSWWRARSKMSVLQDGNSWRIAGDDAGRAVLAFAKSVHGKLVYELSAASVTT